MVGVLILRVWPCNRLVIPSMQIINNNKLYHWSVYKKHANTIPKIHCGQIGHNRKRRSKTVLNAEIKGVTWLCWAKKVVVSRTHYLLVVVQKFNMVVTPIITLAGTALTSSQKLINELVTSTIPGTKTVLK